MRKIIMFNRVSTDGYFAAPDGNLDWVVPEPELEKGAREGMSSADTVMLGRRTYEMFSSYWPHAVDQDPHMPGRRSEDIKAMGKWLNAAQKLVFSRSLKQATWNNSRVLPKFDAGEIRALKQQPGKDIMLFGSGSIVTQLSAHGLIDQYMFVVCPVLLGTGRSLLGDLGTRVRLQLEESKAYPAGNVMLLYTLR